MTYSILAIDRQSGAIGAAMQSKFPGVGSLILHGEAGVGMITTQAFANPRHGQDGLRLLAHGASAQDVVRIVLRDDDRREERQLAVLGVAGDVAGHTGAEVETWDGYAGAARATDCYAHGNSLRNSVVIQAMVDAFVASSGEFGRRLIDALRAGQAAGGELRGQQSAALQVLRPGSGYGGTARNEVDISVYDHPRPIEELARCYELHRLSYFPTRPQDLVPIDDALRIELGTILGELGYLARLPDSWDAHTIAVFRRFMGVENYDNRLRNDAQIDREVLADVRRRHAAKTLVPRTLIPIERAPALGDEAR